MAQEYVFRFLSVRPANLEKQIDLQPQKVGLYTGFTGRSVLSDELANAAGSIESAKVIVAEFRTTNRYVKTVEALPFDVNPGLDWAQKNAKVVATDTSVRAGIESAYGGTKVTALAKDANLQESMGRLADTLLAETVVPNPDRILLDRLSVALKLLVFISEVANSKLANSLLPPSATVGEVIGARTILVPPVGKSGPIRTKDSLLANESTIAPPIIVPAVDTSNLRLALADLEKAHQELSGLATNPNAITLKPNPQSDTDRIASLEAQLKACQSSGQATADTSKRSTILRTVMRPVLADNAVANLSDATKRALANLKVDNAFVDPVASVGMIEKQMYVHSSQLPTT